MEQLYNVTVQGAVNYTRITKDEAYTLKEYYNGLGYHVEVKPATEPKYNTPLHKLR